MFGLMLINSLVFAETVVLKSGKTLQGKIIEKTDKYIKIDIENLGIPLTYFFDDIETIDGREASKPAESAIIANANDKITTENKLETNTPTTATEPKRENGLSVHFVPRSAPELSGSNKNGFMVSQSKDLKSPSERPIFETPEKLVEYLLNQPQEIRENGIWVIVSDPEAYSVDEIGSTEALKSLCRQKNIPLFFCRGMLLPNGWVKADKFNFAESDNLIKAREIENKANAADSRGDYGGAIELYNQALEITPNPAYVIHDRGMAYLHKGEFDKSISDLSKAMEMSPNEKDFIAQCYNDRGNAYYDAGQYEKSWQDVQKAIELGYKVHPGFIAALKSKGYSK